MVKCFRAAIYWPSGDQVGPFSSSKFSRVIWRRFWPLASITQMLSPPPRSEVKAICRPSGEKRGWLSNGRPSAMRVARPPVIGRV